MSILANTTEKDALKILARTLKYFDNLSCLAMTSEDAFAAREAERQIQSIIETNGYYVKHQPGRGTIIRKIKN